MLLLVFSKSAGEKGAEAIISLPRGVNSRKGQEVVGNDSSVFSLDLHHLHWRSKFFFTSAKRAVFSQDHAYIRLKQILLETKFRYLEIFPKHKFALANYQFSIFFIFCTFLLFFRFLIK
jgi:hypothetical protein